MNAPYRKSRVRIECQTPGCLNTAVIHIKHLDGGSVKASHHCKSCGAETEAKLFEDKQLFPGPKGIELVFPLDGVILQKGGYKDPKGAPAMVASIFSIGTVNAVFIFTDAIVVFMSPETNMTGVQDAIANTIFRHLQADGLI